MNPRQIGELFDGKFTDRSLFAFAHPFQGQVIAESVQRKGRRQGPEAALGEAPQQSVGFQVKGGAFPVSLAPYFRKPCNVVTRVYGVWDGVKGVGLSEADNGVVGVV